MKYKILLDMDGVIADFVQGMADWLGLDYPYKDPNEHRWNLEEIWGITSMRMWKEAKRDFWDSLEKTPEADTFVNALTKQFGAANVVMVTAPPAINAGEAVQGKLTWMRWHYPQFAHRMVFTEHKELCAGPDRILFDDNGENVRKFREAGGKAVLVPRPWNELYDKNPLIALEHVAAYVKS